MNCAWRFATDHGRPVPWPCGDAPVCARNGPDGQVQLAFVLPAAAVGGWTVRRDGDLVVDDAVPPPDSAIASGDDGCGHAGALMLVSDRVPFGFHRYTVVHGDEAYGEAHVLALGPGAADPVPGLLLAIGMIAVGTALQRLPASRGA